MTLEALMREAAGAVDAGDLRRAEPLLREIVGLNPRDAEAWHMLAVIGIHAGRAEDALNSARRAHELERRNHLFLNTLGTAHAETGNLEEAMRCFRRALKERPAYAEGHYNLGKVHGKLGELSEAERCYMRARQIDPRRADVANNLAALYSRQGRYRDALALFAEARAALPDDEAIVINSAIAALATSGPEAAIEVLRKFVELHPKAATVRAELGRRLLAEGRFAEGWSEYAWRLGTPKELPERIGKRVLLLPDQGLGDHLFFLRFVEKLRQHAAYVAFACPAKLRALLAGNKVLDGLDDTGDFDLSLPLGDLPRLLADSSTPPALALHPASDRVAKWRERLAALGPGPYLGVMWRGGSRREDASEFAARGEDPLYKEVDLSAFAAALRGWCGTVLVLQRLPAPGETDAFSRALGRAAHDLSAANDELSEMAALLSSIDEYVGVSNTNMHIRAGVGKKARVLVPFPPEFRWMHTEHSRWFPGFPVYRQTSAHDWGAALARLMLEISH
jgi:Flp pilus assembly protein TadD